MVAVLLAGLLLPAVFQSPLGFQFTPPAGFEPMADLSEGLNDGATSAVAPAPPGAGVKLLAAFAEDGGAPASVAIALVESPLEIDQSSPERVAALAIDYIHDLFDTDLHIEWVDRFPVAGEVAIELAGRVSFSDEGEEEEERVVQFAFIPFGDRQLVVTASLPAARFATLGPEIEQAVAALRFDRPPDQPSNHRAELGAIAGAALGLIVAVSRLLWRRRSKPSNEDPVDS